MEIRNRSTGAISTDDQLRRDNPNTSFPQVITVEILDEFGYDPVFEGPQATVVGPYQYSQRDGVVEINGKWYTHYIAGPVFHDYVDDQGVTHTAAEQYEAYCFGIDAQQSNDMRGVRNQRLAESDWTQLADTPFDAATKAAWAAYREELRQVPQQAGFPWEIQWPTKPGQN